MKKSAGNGGDFWKYQTKAISNLKQKVENYLCIVKSEPQGDLEPCDKSIIEFICENSLQLKAVK